MSRIGLRRRKSWRNERTPEHVIDGRFREGVLAVVLHDEVGGAVDVEVGEHSL